MKNKANMKLKKKREEKNYERKNKVNKKKI